ncbi:MAG: AI-2E family transporter, partial [Floccifex sp.]
EFVQAIKLIIDILFDFIDILSNTDTSSIPFSEYVLALDIDWMALKSSIESWFMSFGKDFVNSAANLIGSFVSGFITFFVGLIFSIYILMSKEKLKHQSSRLLKAWIPEKIANYTIHVCEVCSKIFKLYIAGQATEAIILGTLCMIGMLLLRLPYAPMIGALVGVTALIPIVGAFIGCGVGAIMILTVSPFKAIVFVIYFLVLQQIEGNMIYPKVVGSKINLPAIWVLAAITVGGNLGGILGMLFSVPVTSSFYTLLKEATLQREKTIK